MDTLKFPKIRKRGNISYRDIVFKSYDRGFKDCKAAIIKALKGLTNEDPLCSIEDEIRIIQKVKIK